MDLMVDSLETPALTKAHMAELLYEQIGLNKREAKDMVDAFFDVMVDALVQGEEVKISGFGNFQVRTKSARPGRNPRTGASVPVAEKFVPFFKTGKELRERLNGDGH